VWTFSVIKFAGRLEDSLEDMWLTRLTYQVSAVKRRISPKPDPMCGDIGLQRSLEDPTILNQNIPNTRKTSVGPKKGPGELSLHGLANFKQMLGRGATTPPHDIDQTLFGKFMQQRARHFGGLIKTRLAHGIG
jgi:hypothetical protein